MKKKKGLSEEALKTLMAGAEPEVETEVDPAAQSQVTDPEAVEPEAIEPEATDNPEETEEVTTLKTELSDAKGVITDLEAKADEAVVKAEEAEAKTASVVEASEQLKDIVISQISKMRIALSIAAVDMTKWEIGAVVEEYESTSKSFMESLPVGSVVPEEEEPETGAAIATSLDASKIKALGFK